MYSLRILTLVWCAGLGLGADVGVVKGVLPSDPWEVLPSLLRCASSDSPAACVQSRALRALEDSDDKEDDKLPKGVSPAVARVIDRIGDLIASGLSQWYPEPQESAKSASTSDNDIEQARGHHKKKKVHRAIKKAVIKLLIFLYVKAQAIRLFLYGVQTFAMFKMMIFSGIYVLAYVVKTFTLVKWAHHEKTAPKVLYIEPQIKHVTQHHGPVALPEVQDVHHEEYAPAGVEYEVGSDHESLAGLGGVGGLWRRRSAADAHRLAYFKQLPAASNYKTV